VLPESALPEEASVALPEADVAEPLMPPEVLPVALELPESPEVESTVGSELATPVPPEVAVPVAEVPDDGGGSPEPTVRVTLCGFAVADPEFPEPLEELLEPVLLPVAPVVADVV
jgi:hypothetical protein